MTFNDYGVKYICKVFFLQKNGHTICKNVLAKFGTFLAFGNEKTDFFFLSSKKGHFSVFSGNKTPNLDYRRKKTRAKKGRTFLRFVHLSLSVLGLRGLFLRKKKKSFWAKYSVICFFKGQKTNFCQDHIHILFLLMAFFISINEYLD